MLFSAIVSSAHAPIIPSNVNCSEDSQGFRPARFGSRRMDFPTNPKSLATSKASWMCMKWAQLSAQSSQGCAVA